ncbi:MAG: general secretion pathway protein GspK [Candidatus Hydrogenedentes bacterium]|nr:general secretion pathway protein GspK [Candidatus Hydrogenedentota bacterium]MBI3118908.1 general secretion pathway protein GspK [Candidatus Hydrogenedentota bacterium]
MRMNQASLTRIFKVQRLQEERGAALVIAVTLLFLFVVLGAAYVKFGYLEIDETNFALRQARAETLAEAGINAAIGNIHQALGQNQAANALGTTNYAFPSYKAAKDSDPPVLEALENREAFATVSVRDESGKVNVNHAPASVLQRVLNVDGATARAITASLPRSEAGAAPAEGSRWLLSLDDLASRKLLTPEQFEKLDQSLVTTSTVADHAHPGAYLSINTAPAEVLAAVLDVPAEQAQQIMAKGPFNSIAALAEAAGKTVDTFNLHPEWPMTDGMVAPFTIQPNCFRIASSATYKAVSEGHEATASAEAVVLFHEDGSYEIVDWTTAEPEEDAAEEPAAEPAAAEPAPAEATPTEDAPGGSPAETPPTAPAEPAA